MKKPTVHHPSDAPTQPFGRLVGTLSSCGILVALQQTIIVPILPELPDLLDTTAENASWLVTATLLTGAVATPVTSRLADMFGKRLMMMVCLVIATLGSVLAALSTSLVPVIAGRALQGVGMALIPIGIAMMRDELHEDKVPLGVSIMSATLAIGAGAGLPLSGIVSEHLDWHSLFWITGASGVLMLIAVRLLVPESPLKSRGHFDFIGAVLLSSALSALLLVLSKGGVWGWASTVTIATTVCAFLVLAVWIPIELRVPRPLVNLRVAARKVVLLVNIAAVLGGFAMFANMLVSTQLLQLPKSTGYGLELGVVESGLWMAPTALTFGAQISLILGAGLMAACYVFRAFYSDELWQIVVGSMLVSMGTSFMYAAMPIIIMAAVPDNETASANGLNTLLRSVGTAVSSAAVAAVLTSAASSASGHPSFHAFAIVFWIAAGAALAAGLVALPLIWLISKDAGVEVEEGSDTALLAEATEPA